MKGCFDFIDLANRALPLYQKFTGALEGYLESVEPGFVSVLVCGSFAQNKITGASDLDVLIVLPDGSTRGEDFREVLVHGVPVQIFAATEKDLLGAFEWELRSSSRQRTSLVAHGKVVAGDPVVGERLLATAQRTLTSPPPPLDLSNARSMLNFLESHFPEPMDRLFETSRYGFLMTWNGMMDKYFHLSHQLESKLLPRHQDMDADLSSIDDRELGRAYCQALVETDLEERKRLFFALSELIRKRLRAFVGVESQR